MTMHCETTADLLDACCEWVRKYVRLSPDQVTVIAAWILHTWAIDAAYFTPYLHITAPEKRCGKSRLLDTLEYVVCKPCKSGNMSPAALVRVVNKHHATLLLDEMDVALGGNKESVEVYRGVLNNGFERGKVFVRCTGKNFEVEEFDVFGAKALAGIGRLPDTVADRSIPIEMKRKKVGDKFPPARGRDVKAAAKTLVEKLQSWASKQTIDTLSDARPIADGLEDRQLDISEPLLAIADLAGGEWPVKLRDSLGVLFHSEASEDTSNGVWLLRDIWEIFAERIGMDVFNEHGRQTQSDRISSFEMCTKLNSKEDAPWREGGKAERPLTQSGLAHLLKPYHVSPRTIRFGHDPTQKGYLKEDFADPWVQFCPDLASLAVTPVTTRASIDESSLSGAITQAVTESSVKGAVLHETPRQQRSVTAVTSHERIREEIRDANPFINGRL